MINYMQRLTLIITISLILSSCWSYGTTTDYSDDFKIGYSVSEPIYLTIKNTEKNTVYFILERDINSDKFFLKLHWIYKNKKRQLKEKNNLLRFLVDNIEIVSLHSLQKTKIISYHIDPPALEEECIFTMTRSDLESLAKAKNVVVEIEGKYENKIASFNRFHTFKAFKNFLKNS